MSGCEAKAEAECVVHLAWAPLCALLDDPARLHGGGLSAAERKRLADLPTALRRRQFVAGRWLLRRLLETCWGPAPAGGWCLSAQPGRPPGLDGAEAPRLSLAHSGEQVLAALCRLPVGVDLECPRPGRDVERLAQAACTPEEIAALAALDRGERRDRFYALWTLKEAHFKRQAATGAGWSELLARRSRPCAGRRANGWTWHCEGSVLALAARPGSRVCWQGQAPPGPPQRWWTDPGYRPGASGGTGDALASDAPCTATGLGRAPSV